MLEISSQWEGAPAAEPQAVLPLGGSRLFWVSKRVFDIGMSLLLLPLLGMIALVLLALNPIWNKGPLFFYQKRMGRGCKPFVTVKFRTMTKAARIKRRADDPIEEGRITTLGRLLRRTRIDELPQIINVLRGSMSLVGPRPDYFPHALKYLKKVPGYAARHMVRPGISGLAQVDVGYVQSITETHAKVDADLIYIRDAGFALEARIVAKTIAIVATAGGR